MKITVMGLGVVGGTLYDVLRARTKHTVYGYDPFKPGFGDVSVLDDSDVTFVCVWTPMVNDKLDEQAVWDAVAEAVGPRLVVVRSTVMPGTMSALAETFPGQEFAFVPEFLTEDDPMGTMTKADRVVVGSWGPQLELESVLEAVTPGAPIVRMRPEEAVMVKLASNAMLAAKVALANEIARICDAYEVRYDRVRGAVGLDRRISPDHLKLNGRGGYGGSCFPKDVRGLIYAARAEGVAPSILEEIEATNDLRYE